MSEPFASPPPPPPPPAPPSSTSASNQAITALVLGILGVICCPLAGPVAWYLGQVEGRVIKEGRAPVAGEGLALAGKILGILGTIFLLLSCLWIFAFGGMMFFQGLGHHW